MANAGLCVVSGMARGIDSAAHEGALAAGGRTIAVIGSGLGKIYPPENQNLAEKISANGAVISEFPIDGIIVAEMITVYVPNWGGEMQMLTITQLYRDDDPWAKSIVLEWLSIQN